MSITEKEKDMAKCRNCGAEIEQSLYDLSDGLCIPCSVKSYKKKKKKRKSKPTRIVRIMIGLGVVGLILIIVGTSLSAIGYRESVDSPLASSGLTLAIIGAIFFAIAIGYATRGCSCGCPNC